MFALSESILAKRNLRIVGQVRKLVTKEAHRRRKIYPGFKAPENCPQISKLKLEQNKMK